MMAGRLRIYCLVHGLLFSALVAAGTESAAGPPPALFASVVSDTCEGFVVYATVLPPGDANGSKVQAELAKMGIQSGFEREGLLWMSMNRAQIRRLFRTRVEMRNVAASSRPGMVREPYLVSPMVPMRWRRYLDQVVLDNQL